MTRRCSTWGYWYSVVLRRLWMAWARITGRFVLCPDCGSCGVGGCCSYFCARCKDRHDGDAPDGRDAPDDRGRMRPRWLP